VDFGQRRGSDGKEVCVAGQAVEMRCVDVYVED